MRKRCRKLKGRRKQTREGTWSLIQTIAIILVWTMMEPKEERYIVEGDLHCSGAQTCIVGKYVMT